MEFVHIWGGVIDDYVPLSVQDLRGVKGHEKNLRNSKKIHRKI
jgi:hypothetical protein